MGIEQNADYNVDYRVDRGRRRGRELGSVAALAVRNNASGGADARGVDSDDLGRSDFDRAGRVGDEFPFRFFSGARGVEVGREHVRNVESAVNLAVERVGVRFRADFDALFDGGALAGDPSGARGTARTPPKRTVARLIFSVYFLFDALAKTRARRVRKIEKIERASSFILRKNFLRVYYIYPFIFVLYDILSITRREMECWK